MRFFLRLKISLFFVAALIWGSQAMALDPIPQSELCAPKVATESQKQTEASTDCLNCLADQVSPGLTAPLAETKKLTKKLSEESEAQRLVHEYSTAITILQGIGFNRHGESIQNIFMNSEGLKKAYATNDHADGLKVFLKIRAADYRAIQKLSLKELRKDLAKAEAILKKSIKVEHTALCGLSLLELFSIKAYTGNLSREINSALRDKNYFPEARKNYTPYVETLKGALAKLKDYDQTVTRGVNYTPADWEKHEKGELLTYDAFTSTSRLPIFDHTNTRLIIRSKSGKYIAPFSSHFNEEEILFSPDTQFQVLDKKIEAGKMTITLEEVKSASK